MKKGEKNMKKILTVLIITLMMAGLFAYEPKKEFFEVRDDMVYYNEEVEPQYGGDGIRRFLSTGPIAMEKEAHFQYSMFELERKMIYSYLDRVKRTADEEKKENYKTKAENCINRVINEIAFITEKNFWTITERNYVKMFCKYLKKIQKEELKKQKKNK